jgi:hypothetical protein
MAIGIRFAGTAHYTAFKTLRRFIHYMQRWRRTQQQLNKVEKTTVENALDTIAIALSLVMAGSVHSPLLFSPLTITITMNPMRLNES